MPGPEVDVNARAPFHAAPTTIPMAAISSSAWMIRYWLRPVSGSRRYFSQNPVNASISDVDGVIGYQAATVAPAYKHPSAVAVLPSMRIVSSAVGTRSSRISSGQAKCVRA